MRSRFRRQRDEAGATLVMALIILTTIALVTGVVLSHAFTNERATVVLRSVAGTSYAADAGAKEAINNLVLGRSAAEWTTPSFNGTWNSADPWWLFTNNADGTGCFGATGASPRTALELQSIYPRSGNQTRDTSVRVRCTAVPGTGLLGGSGGVKVVDANQSDPFAQALTTVGKASDPHDGIQIDVSGQGNTNSAPIGGGIASATSLNVDHGDVTTDGYARASSCGGSGRIISPDKKCSVTIPSPTVPSSPLSAVPTFVDPAEVNNCRFGPGYYNSGKSLSAAVNACPIAYFASGNYYFDFTDDTPWTVNTKVIGGEPTSNATIPGACTSPLTSPTTAGVQFVFGGSSTISIDNSAKVELCGKSNGGDPPLTIYQQQVGTLPVTTTVGPLAGASASSTGVAFDTVPAGGSLAAAVAATDTLVAKWVSTKKNDTGQLDVSGFPGLATIPRNATIKSASVNVSFSGDAPAPVVGLNGGTTSALSGGSADVTAQMRTLLAAGSFTGTRPTVQIKIPTSNKGDTLSIDKVSLSVVWDSAVLRPATNTTFISTKSNSKAQFVIQGATYAPQGYVVMSPGNDPSALIAFRWGLLAQGVNFVAQPQQAFGFPLVSVPSPGRGLGNTVTVVDLEVFVCVESLTCAEPPANTKPDLKVRVLITDPPWTTRPVEGKRKTEILSWAEKN